jgi:hypothetical protein
MPHANSTWQTGLGGIDWLDPLVSSGRAASMSHGGYPETYLISCRDFMTRLDEGLPHERPTWGAD